MRIAVLVASAISADYLDKYASAKANELIESLFADKLAA